MPRYKKQLSVQPSSTSATNVSQPPALPPMPRPPQLPMSGSMPMGGPPHMGMGGPGMRPPVPGPGINSHMVPPVPPGQMMPGGMPPGVMPPGPMPPGTSFKLVFLITCHIYIYISFC